MMREALLGIVRQLSRVVPSKTMVPAFANVWFDGTTALATDGMVTVEIPCDLELTGGVNCGRLLTFLTTSRGGDVKAKEVKKDGGSIQFTSGRSRISLPLSNAENRPSQEWPSTKAAVPLQWDQVFECIESASMTMCVDNSRAWMSGMTVEIGGGEAKFFTTTGTEIVCASAQVGTKKKLEAVLSDRLVSLVLAFAKTFSGVKLHATEAWTQVEFEGCRVYAANFTEINLATYHKGVSCAAKSTCPIPDGLAHVVQGAGNLISSPGGTVAFAISDGKLSLSTQSDELQFSDELDTDHPDVEAKFNPALIGKALKVGREFGISGGDSPTILVTWEGARYLAASVVDRGA